MKTNIQKCVNYSKKMGNAYIREVPVLNLAELGVPEGLRSSSNLLPSIDTQLFLPIMIVINELVQSLACKTCIR